MESAPDRLVEHVLRTITKQLGAHSSSVWQRDEASGMIDFQFSFEDGKFVTTSGVSTGIDMALAIIARFVSAEIAEKTAVVMEYEWHRDAARDPFAKMHGLV